MKILFWNAGRKNVSEHLSSMVRQHEIDILVLAEYDADQIELLNSLRSTKLDFKKIDNVACTRLLIYSTYPITSFRHKLDSDHYSIKEVSITGVLNFLLVSVHLPSKLYADEDAHVVHATQLREQIEEVEIDCKTDNTIVIGDFNMNPFETGMMAVNSLNAIPCIRAHKKSSRKFGIKDYKFFYNPSWNLMGDRNLSAGTYFHGSPRARSEYWNTLDQVLIRPSIASRITGLDTLTEAGEKKLISAISTPNVSDHLPILLSITMEGNTE